VPGRSAVTASAELGQTAEHRVWRFRGDASQEKDDLVTVEEPLEIRLNGEALAVVMRTPKNDFELAAGFVFTEGIVQRLSDLGTVSYCPEAQPPNLQNVVDARLASGVEVDIEKVKRNFYASSSCGICGKASIDAIRTSAPAIETDFQVSVESLYGLQEGLRKSQEVFAQTGSLHAAALFDADGDLLVVREDVGRHNAVDKLVGFYVLQGKTLPREVILMVSGRTSFEIVQKALMAGIPVIAGVSAPSSLAIQMAEEANMTLIGFLRGNEFNLYSGPQRIATKGE
jgi:FdhD protein